MNEQSRKSMQIKWVWKLFLLLLIPGGNSGAQNALEVETRWGQCYRVEYSTLLYDSAEPFFEIPLPGGFQGSIKQSEHKKLQRDHRKSTAASIAVPVERQDTKRTFDKIVEFYTQSLPEENRFSGPTKIDVIYSDFFVANFEGKLSGQRVILEIFVEGMHREGKRMQATSIAELSFKKSKYIRLAFRLKQ